MKGHRRPSAEPTGKIARYYGVSQASIMRLAGLEVAELDEWLEYGDLLLLRRERRERMEASGEK